MHSIRIKFVFSVIFATVFVTATSASEVNDYQVGRCRKLACGWCNFHNVSILDRNQKVKLTSDSDPSDITKVQFINSTINIFTGHICKSFPYLTALKVEKSQLREIAPESFRHCYELKLVSFWMNNLTRLDRHSLQHNQKLQGISFQSNQIVFVHREAFNHLYDLQWLNLNDNHLMKFEIDGMVLLNKLRTIDLSRNYLRDLLAERLVDNLPALKALSIDDNDFKCQRLQLILDYLKSKDVTISTWVRAKKKSRKIEALTIDGIECYEDRPWLLNSTNQTVS